MIKKRDFWMPFAPSIRAEAAERYLADPKDLRPYFMTLAYPAHQTQYEDLVAGSHPRDGTIRSQVVTAGANPGYHHLITEFERGPGRPDRSILRERL